MERTGGAADMKIHLIEDKLVSVSFDDENFRLDFPEAKTLSFFLSILIDAATSVSLTMICAPPETCDPSTTDDFSTLVSITEAEKSFLKKSSFC